jgi:hypothetical protein
VYPLTGVTVNVVLTDPGTDTVSAEAVFVRAYPGARIETVIAFELDGANPASPLYSATIGYVPLGSKVVVSTATPELFTGAVPRTAFVVAFVKFTVPVGFTPAKVDATVAVRVTLVAGGTGFADEIVDVNVVLVGTSATFTVSTLPVLLAKLASPPYVAEIVFVPAGRPLIAMLAALPVSVSEFPYGTPFTEN